MNHSARRELGSMERAPCVPRATEGGTEVNDVRNGRRRTMPAAVLLGSWGHSGPSSGIAPDQDQRRGRAGGRSVSDPLGAALPGLSAGTQRSTLAPPEGREEGQQQAMRPRYRRSAESFAMAMDSVERAVFPALVCVLAARATGARVACPPAGRPGCFELKKNITLEVPTR